MERRRSCCVRIFIESTQIAAIQKLSVHLKIMELLVFFIWILLALAIPLILLATSYFKYTQQVEISKVIFRLCFAFAVYLPITVFPLLFFGGLLNAVVHKKISSPGEIFFCFVSVFAYAVAGWLLWSFVNGSFVKFPLNRNFGKPQSIFDKQ